MPSAPLLTPADTSAQNWDESNLEATAPPRPNIMTQQDLVDAFMAAAKPFCEQQGLKDERRRALRAVKGHLGKSYVPTRSPPTAADAPLKWSNRKNDPDPERDDPVKFLDRHWGEWLDEGVLDQCTFRKLDPKLFEAIKSWCRRYKLDLPSHLPPPARKQTQRHASAKPTQRRTDQNEKPKSGPVRPARQSGWFSTGTAAPP